MTMDNKKIKKNKKEKHPPDNADIDYTLSYCRQHKHDLGLDDILHLVTL